MNVLHPLHRFAIAVVSMSLLTACSNDPVSTKPLPLTSLEDQVWATSLNVNLATMVKLSSSVYIRDDVVGTGATLTGSPTVFVYYAGYLASGFRFDVRARPNTAADFPLDDGVIAGFRLGMQGMKVGGKRRLLIPSSLGYRETGIGDIPGNANLLFDIELTAIN